MKIIVKFLLVALMCVITSGVFAQTSKTNAAKLSENDVVLLKKALSKKQMFQDDSVMVELLLERHNEPIVDTIGENGEIVEKSQVGDDLMIYIYNQYGSFWLSYEVKRKNKFVGRLDIRLN